MRCLVCQNESIDDSDAPLAHDLRVLLRQRILAGDTDEGAQQYIVARYGDYVLLKPPLKKSTLALWLGPLLLFTAAMGGAALFYRRRMEKEVPLTGEEQKKLLALMKSEESRSMIGFIFAGLTSRYACRAAFSAASAARCAYTHARRS